jgi:hypothetical protein
MIEETQKEKIFLINTINDFFSSTREVLDKSKEKRIKFTFEMKLDLSKFSLNDLQEFATAPIEFLLIKRMGNYVISTGMSVSVMYDFLDDLDQLDPNSAEYAAIIGAANFLAESVKKTDGEFSLHNHPTDEKDLVQQFEYTCPSEDDLEITSESGTKIDIITTRFGVVLFKASPSQLEEYRKHPKQNSPKEQFDLLSRLGVIKKRIAFTDSKITPVLEMIRGNKKWEDIKNL